MSFDLPGGRHDRDVGMARVTKANAAWNRAARSMVEDLPAGWRGLSEDIREMIEPVIGAPRHRNVYGSLIRVSLRWGVLRHTGRRLQMRLRTSHARKTDELERTDMGFPGFETVDRSDPDVEPRPRGGRRSRRPPTTDQTQRGCDACALKPHWRNIHTPRMPIDGDAAADILVIGEAPGEDEDKTGRPFTGPSGQLLRRILPHRQARRIAMTNAVRCRPPRNRNPDPHELHACSLHLETDLTERPIRAILGLGGVPLGRVLTGESITKIHGLKFPVELAGRLVWYFPTLHPAYVLRQERDGGRSGESSAMPILENDIATFFREVDSWPEPLVERPDPAAVIQARSADEVRGYLAKMTDPIGLDIETNDLRATTGKAQILTAAIADGDTMVAWPIYHQQGANDWGLPLLLEIAATRRWIAHNAAFELAWLREHARRLHAERAQKYQTVPRPLPWGDDWWPEAGWEDSMASARLYQRRDTCLNLGILTRIYCGVNIKELSTINTAKINDEPLPEVLRYNGIDAWGCWRIHSLLHKRVSREHYRALLDTITSTTEMQLVGVDVDQDAVEELRQHWQGRADRAVKRAAGIHEAKQYFAATQKEFSITSNVQVGEALVRFGKIELPKTADGQYKTDDKTLTTYAPDNPLAQTVLEHRHAIKMVRTYVRPMQEAPDHAADRRLHPIYSTMLTRTFRLSAENPPIQQFPKRKDVELRTPVMPPKGCLWVAADFGQLEARVYGMASQDKELCRSIIDEEDIHSYWLRYILDRYPPYLDRLAHMVTPNETEAQIIKGGRDIIKSDFTFASFYGTTARNVAERTGIPYDIAMDVLGDFWTRYRGANAWLKRQRQQYRDTGMTRDLLGRERYGLMGGNEMINTPIQGTAAALVLDAQNELCRLAREWGDPCVLPRINIHDDLVFAMPDDLDEIRAYIDGISQILTKVRYRWQIVPLMVEWRIGDNWAELLPLYKHTGDYVR